MKYSEWAKIYEKILKDFGYDRHKDEESAKLASKMVSIYDKQMRKEELSRIISGRKVLICGNAPTLESELRKISKEKDIFEYVVISADGATSVLLRNGILPDVIVTDLDGIIADIIYANRLGSAVIVHAHGDNREKIRKVLPELRGFICTTQSRPIENVYNFGGFTDGDRCVFIAKEFQASSIKMIGFYFDDPSVSETKKKKLKWAKKLIEEII